MGTRTMRSAIVLWALAASAVIGTALVVGADFFTHSEAAGHVRLHALVALVLTGVALALGRRAARTGRTMVGL